MGKYDSAYHYAILNKTFSDSIYNQQKLNNIQDQTYARKIYEIEFESKQQEIQQEHKKNIQFILIAVGLVTLLIAFLLFSRSFITNTKFIEFFGVVAMLMVFEFLNLILHPFLEKITHHSLILMLLALVCIAALLVPLHHKIEKWAIERLVKKNKEIRLANAKHTIEKLS